MQPQRAILITALMTLGGLVLSGCAESPDATTATAAPLWFAGGTVIVGDGSAPIVNAAVLVAGDTIAWVGPADARSPPAGAIRIDVAGKTLLPALIDGHNHIGLDDLGNGTSSQANYTRANLVDHLERYAYYGVAAALSMGLEADPALAYALRDQPVPGAALFLTVGKGIAATRMGGPQGAARLGIPYGAETAEAGRQHVRALAAAGVRFVKIWVDDRGGAAPKLDATVYRAIIDEAHGRDMQVLAHIGRTSALADAKDLLRAGVDGFVHTVRDRDVDAEYLDLVRAHPDTWTGPNLPESVLSAADVESLAQTLPPPQVAELRARLAADNADGEPQPDAYFELHCRNLRAMQAAGMTLGLGTDGTGDGFGIHQELVDYTRCGLSPMAALVAATATNARLLGLERMGTLAAGKQADLLVLNADPLEDIANTRQIAAVWLRGRQIDRAALSRRWTAP